MTQPLPEPSLERLSSLIQDAYDNRKEALEAFPPEPNETPADHKKRVGTALLVVAAYRAGQEDLQAHVMPVGVALQVLGSSVRLVLGASDLDAFTRALLSTTMTLLESKVGKEALSMPKKGA